MKHLAQAKFIDRRWFMANCAISSQLLLAPESSSAMQASDNPKDSSPKFNASKAVLDGFLAATQNLYSKAIENRAGSNDFKAFATSWTILFRHLEEIGYMEYASKISTAIQVFDKPLDPSFTDQMINMASKAGFRIDQSQVSTAIAISQKEWPSVQAIYSKQGISGLTEHSVTTLHRYADELLRSGRIAARVDGEVSPAFRRIVGSEFCAAVAIISVYCATLGWMEFFAIISVPGLAAVLVCASMALAVAGMFC